MQLLAQTPKVRRNNSITSRYFFFSICINPKSAPWIGINFPPSHPRPLDKSCSLFLWGLMLIVDLSRLCRAHKLWLKRRGKHSGLPVWESGDIILCHYLTGPASAHLLPGAVSGGGETSARGLRGSGTLLPETSVFLDNGRPVTDIFISRRRFSRRLIVPEEQSLATKITMQLPVLVSQRLQAWWFRLITKKKGWVMFLSEKKKL